MRRAHRIIAIAASVSLLTLQLSGVHAHEDSAGHISLPESSYSHSHSVHGHAHPHPHPADKADHDHEGDPSEEKEISLFETGPGGNFKLPMAAPAFVQLLLVVPHEKALARALVSAPVLSGRHTRWRPPLRAPPSSI